MVTTIMMMVTAMDTMDITIDMEDGIIMMVMVTIMATTTRAHDINMYLESL